jgi:2-oxo-3-hexenedioate decarboxylase
MSAPARELALVLERAQIERRPIPPVTTIDPSLDIAAAYDVQRELCERLRSRTGAGIAGYKVGLTSSEKMRQMGVFEPIYGLLLEGTGIADGGTCAAGELIHPRVEPEIAIVLRDALHGPDCTRDGALAAVGLAAPAIEIIDSRYERFRFDLPSVIADNGSAARFVVGAGRTADGLDLAALAVTLERDGAPATAGFGAAVLGHPAESVARLANWLGERGAVLPAGSLILTGGVTEAIAVAPGDEIRVRVEALGAAAVRFV